MKNNDIELMSCEELKKVIVAKLESKEAGRHGRNQCAWCKKDMGVCLGLARGLVSHGICPTCKAVFLADAS